MDSNTITVRGFNTPFIPVGNSSRQKINKETQVLNDTLDQMGLTDIYRTFHSKAAEFTFFSSTHRTFSTIDHILDHKTSLGKFKKIEIVIKYLSQPQGSQIRNQLQEKNCNTHKCGEKNESMYILCVTDVKQNYNSHGVKFSK